MSTDIKDVLKVAGAACQLADMVEEFIEFVESLGPHALEFLCQSDEFCALRDCMEDYVSLRNDCDVNLYADV
jgi:hypothetical protein